MQLGKNIEKLRMKAGISREKFAQKCGGEFTAIHLMRIENGSVKNPGIEMVKAIAEGLGVKIDALVEK
ncbi:MAG: helix-turn-helix domain-containing protein [Candidatus Margulisbacteria bacterium]|nr:helix-turn-helix domain-containing protein [Candidatus Margulisiibacteriota bacterium]MBU1021817.1 helix-turn-helix domain-containing protein [Candidatus Margulisiibacteriota bacterium]MBU1728976.1 helix-turn-helix domain-containing protein [Candidatus Margulisiibacteriota bacterium]MBU1954471.1 helix-turn-helix domain-containing protein [Candidatus Margulisiibacteriota bacterium]